MWEMNVCVLLSEQFGGTSVRRATVGAMQNGLSVYMVDHWKASRHRELCLRAVGPARRNILILPSVWVPVRTSPEMQGSYERWEIMSVLIPPDSVWDHW